MGAQDQTGRLVEAADLLLDHAGLHRNLPYLGVSDQKPPFHPLNR